MKHLILEVYYWTEIPECYQHARGKRDANNVCYACFVAEVQSHLLVVLFFASDVLLTREEKCGFIYTDDSNLYTRDLQRLFAQGPHSNDICGPHACWRSKVWILLLDIPTNISLRNHTQDNFYWRDNVFLFGVHVWRWDDCAPSYAHTTAHRHTHTIPHDVTAGV